MCQKANTVHDQGEIYLQGNYPNSEIIKELWMVCQQMVLVRWVKEIYPISFYDSAYFSFLECFSTQATQGPAFPFEVQHTFPDFSVCSMWGFILFWEDFVSLFSIHSLINSVI